MNPPSLKRLRGPRLRSAVGRVCRPGLFATLLFVAAPASSRAQEIVDWLTFGAGADRNHFGLVNDNGQSFATGEVRLTSGVFAPFSPGGSILESPFWSVLPPSIDSVLGDGTTRTTRVQVAPQAGSVSFQLEVRAADLSQMIFSVGQLFGPGDSAPHEIFLQARTLSGAAVMLEFLGTRAWDSGVRSYTQPLTWDGSKLSLSLGASGESEFAFFRIPAGTEPVTALVFDVPNGYAVGNGDALEFAFGMPIPEPAVAVMLVVGAATVALARKFRRA